MATQLATARQPFAPLNSSRLQNLTSLKNRQNAITSLTSPSKRKATAYESDNDNSENIDPVIFLSPKRSKHPDGTHTSKDALCKPTNFFLTRAPLSSNDFSSLKPAATSSRRPILNAQSPAAPRLDTSRSTPLSVPAGRSPTRKRIGILNRRKTGSPFARVDPPNFSGSSSSSSIGLGFSIDAALSGTIPSYTSRQAAPAPTAPTAQDLPIPVLHQETAKESWFFDIHEDTEEELATNLMEHSTCTLDISSDEESAARERDLRGKENVPPMDDISQTRTILNSLSSSAVSLSEMSMPMDTEASISHMKARLHRASRKGRKVEENAIELDRSPLGDLAAEDFYAECCDANKDVVIEDVEHEQEASDGEVRVASTFDFSADVTRKGMGVEVDLDLDALMKRSTEEAPKARLLEPIEKAEEGFQVWESGSAQGDDN